MTTTTGYGTWNNRVDKYNLNVAGTVSDAFGSEGAAGFDFTAIVEAYRQEINEALPPEVSLTGDEFIGPYYAEDCDFDGYPTRSDGTLNIKAIVKDIDLRPIIEAHELPPITLHETNSDLLVLARGDEVWAMGAPGASPGYLEGTFATDAQAWYDGDWEPAEADGQRPTTTEDVTAVAEWTPGGVRLLADADRIGAAARIYLGDSIG